jgi:hypothetical protein
MRHRSILVNADRLWYDSARCRRTQQLKAVTHALASIWRVRPSAVVTAFLVCGSDSDTMRYVGGGVLNNPDTRASQIRERGLRIERGGRAKACKSVQRKRWHGSKGHTSKRSGICDFSRYRLRFAQTFTKGQL